MATLTIPNRFRDGEALTGAAAKIDANFAAVATLVNTTKLDKDNFRPMAAITNDKKAAPFSLALASISIPTLTATAGKSWSFDGLWAFPHYLQAKNAASQWSDGSTYPDKNIYQGTPFEIIGINGCFHGSANWNTAADDTLKAQLFGLKQGASVVAQLGTDLTLTAADNALVTQDIATATGLVYAELRLVLTTSSTVRTRSIYNLMVGLVLRYAHVK